MRMMHDDESYIQQAKGAASSILLQHTISSNSSIRGGLLPHPSMIHIHITIALKEYKKEQGC